MKNMKLPKTKRNTPKKSNNIPKNTASCCCCYEKKMSYCCESIPICKLKAEPHLGREEASIHESVIDNVRIVLYAYFPHLALSVVL